MRQFYISSEDESFPLDKMSIMCFTNAVVLLPFIIVQCTGGILFVNGTDTFYQVKPNTGQISNADIIYLEFAIPLIERLSERLDGNVAFQSLLHGITRGYPADTPRDAAILCGTALVLTYTRGVLLCKDITYPEGGLEELKDELECHKQTHVLEVARELSRLLTPFTLWEYTLNGFGVVQNWRKKEINTLSRGINNLLAGWG